MTAPDRVELGDLSGLADGQMRAFPEIGEHGIVVCRVAGTLHAVEDICSHADTPLSDGRLRGAMLVCPLHGAQFDVRDGTHQGPPAWTGVACHPISEQGGVATVEVAPRRADDAPRRDVGGRFDVR
jgi:3-phenylpropionate/trans-cinnamate dioxygenase ferredoxin subunit